jgi:hypothetical protein
MHFCDSQSSLYHYFQNSSGVHPAFCQNNVCHRALRRRPLDSHVSWCGRSRRLSFGVMSAGSLVYTTAGSAQYTARQLDYIAQVFREMLRVRQLTLQVRLLTPRLSSCMQDVPAKTLSSAVVVLVLLVVVAAIVVRLNLRYTDFCLYMKYFLVDLHEIWYKQYSRNAVFIFEFHKNEDSENCVLSRVIKGNFSYFLHVSFLFR